MPRGRHPHGSVWSVGIVAYLRSLVLSEEDVAARLPVGDEGGFELAGLVVGVSIGGGEADGVAEHIELVAEFGVGLVGEVIEKAAADAGGRYTNVEAFGYISGGEPEGVHSALVTGQALDLGAPERAGFPFELVFEGEEVHLSEL